MIPPEGRIHWRKTAPFHLQLELDQPAIQLELAKEYQHWHGARIECRVARLFRSDNRLAVGDPVSFRIYVCEPGSEPTGPAYIYKQDLLQTTHLEAYLYGEPPDCQLAAYEFEILKGGPTDKPILTIDQLKKMYSHWEKRAMLSPARWKEWLRVWKA
jgi:hypothetical protein